MTDELGAGLISDTARQLGIGVFEQLPEDPLDKKAICLEVRFSCPTFTKLVKKDQARVTVNRSQTVETEDQKDPDQDRMQVRKKTLDCSEVVRIKKMETRVRSYLEVKCVPSMVYKKGVVLLPLRSLDEVYIQLRIFQQELSVLVETLIQVYDIRKAEARSSLGELFSEKDYPTPDQLRDMIKIYWVPRARGVPQTLREFRAEIFAEEQAKVVDLCRQEYDYVRQLLRVDMNRMVDHLVDVLTPGPQGERKVFKDSTVDNIQRFLAEFDARNITDDDQLATVVARCREVLNGVDPKDLRKSSMVSHNVRDGLQEVQRLIRDQVTTANRQYDWDD